MSQVPCSPSTLDRWTAPAGVWGSAQPGNPISLPGTPQLEGLGGPEGGWHVGRWSRDELQGDRSVWLRGLQALTAVCSRKPRCTSRLGVEGVGIALPHLHPWGLTDYTEGFGLKIDTLETRASPTSEVIEGEGEDPGVELEGKTLTPPTANSQGEAQRPRPASCTRLGVGSTAPSSLGCKPVCSVAPDSLRPHGLLPTRLLRPLDSPGKITGADCCFLLQGIFLTQGLNPISCIGRRILYP